MTGGGVVGTVAGRAVMIGKPDFLRNENITGLEPLEAAAVKLQEEGKTAMFVAIDGKPAGILAVADPIKATTAEAIERTARARPEDRHAHRRQPPHRRRRGETTRHR